MNPFKSVRLRFLFALALILLRGCFPGPLPAATVTGNLVNLGFGPLNTPILFTCTNNPQILPGIGFGVGPSISVTPSNGILSTNLSPGGYIVRIPPYQFTISVPTDTNSYDIGALATSGVTTYTYTNNFQYAVKLAAGDTNAGFLTSKLIPGANITFTTNGSSTLTISASSGGAGQPAAPALSNLVNQASNVYVGAFTGNAGSLTNLNAAANSLATSSQLSAATNNMNTPALSAFYPTNAWDLAGTGAAFAFAATNGLNGLSAFYPTNAFDLAGTAAAKATASTNALGTLSAFKPTGFFNQTANNGSDFASMVRAGSNITGIVSIKAFGALGGTNDDTAAFQAALNYAAPVWVDSTTNYTVKNLYPTNNSCLLGAASQIMFNTACTGNMFSNSATITNVTFSGLILFGQNFGFTGNGLSGGANSAPFDYTPGFLGIRQTASVLRSGFMGCSVSPYSTIKNCYAVGFSDAGFRFYGNGAFPQPEYQTFHFMDNGATACWDGLDMTNSAEYMPILNFTTAACGQGISVQAGNDLINGGQDTRDGVGVAVYNGTNPGHSAVENRTINHCYMAVLGYGVNIGELFDGCVFEGGSAIFYTNCTGMTVQNCTFSPGSSLGVNSGFDILVDGTGGGGLNYFINNTVSGSLPKIGTANGGVVPLVNGWKNRQGAWLNSTNSFPSYYTGTNFFTSTLFTTGITDSGTISGTFTGSGSGLTTLNASSLSSGTVATARLGSGTANSTTYLRGDNTWATPAGGGSQTPWTSAIDGGGFGLSDVSTIAVTNAASFTNGAASGLVINAGLGSNSLQVVSNSFKVLGVTTNGVLTAQIMGGNPLFPLAAANIVKGAVAGSTGAASDIIYPCNSVCGSVQITVGGTGSGAGTLFYLTNLVGYTSIPTVLVDCADSVSAGNNFGNGSGLYVDRATQTTNSFRVNVSAAYNAGTMIFNYHILANQ